MTQMVKQLVDLIRRPNNQVRDFMREMNDFGVDMVAGLSPEVPEMPPEASEAEVENEHGRAEPDTPIR